MTLTRPRSRAHAAPAARRLKRPDRLVSPLDQRSLTDRTYEWLKEQIFTGRLAPGERLSIDEVAGQLRVSRTPVRDALHRLSFEGLAVLTARSGTAVARLSIDGVRDVYEARRVVEPAIAAVAATKATPGALQELQRVQEAWEHLDPAAIYSRFAVHSRYAELDVRFHQIVADMVGNRPLSRLVGQLAVQRQVAPSLFGSGYRGPARRVKEHRAILAALTRRDGSGAADAMRTHLERSQSELLEFLEQSAGEAGSPGFGAAPARR